MKSNDSRVIRNSGKPIAIAGDRALTDWLIPCLIMLATGAAFVPSLSNDFVVWDDDEMLLNNPHFRGLSWSHLAWMFTTFHMGHYKPLSWLTLGLDYTVWGMNPAGYHLTSLLLHSANAVVFYFISRRLLALASPAPERQQSWPIALAAAFAACFFALHPLRVESVAWATERRDVLYGFFYLCAVLAYLRAQTESGDAARRRHWFIATLILFVLSLLSKVAAITFPIALLLLDIYPLRRLSWNIRSWQSPEARRVWGEKLIFVAIAFPFAVIAIFSVGSSGALTSLATHGIEARLAQVCFGMGFYLWKTLLPAGLSPLYQIPPGYSFWNWATLIGVATALLLSWVFYRLRNRQPAGLASWLYYLALLAPVLGGVANGPQLVADRYSYLSCLSWAVLAGGVLLFLWRKAVPRASLARTAALGFCAASIIIALAILTWQQSLVWRNTETLWTHVIKKDPQSSFGHYNLAREVARQGRRQQAIDHYREALRIRPYDPEARNNLGLLLAVTGEFDASLAELRRAIEIAPQYAKAYFNLGRVLARQGDLDGAVENFEKALKLDPGEAEIHLALGTVFTRMDRSREAGERFQQAVRLKPDLAEAHAALARWLAGHGEKDQAASHYEEALRLMKARAQLSSASVAHEKKISPSKKTVELAPGEASISRQP
jgi:tetratricopeptide (TPR) repeat protein